ncbi:MAG: ankyrin repeat domain-containing protein [Prevotella sp.]|nr:ankyrin repeat domain-containing protein [Prevotella sp.]
MKTDLFMCIFRGDVKEYNRLVKKIKDINECEDESSWLHYALASNNYSEDIVLDLINRGIDINKLDPDGASPLEYCCEYKNLKIAKILLEKGAIVNTVDKWGNNPLWRAMHKWDHEMARLLMKYGADPNNVNKVGKTPLSAAREKGDEEMVAILSGQ